MKLRRRIPSDVRENSPETMQLLMAYEWPGNIRELENVMERALSLCAGSIIGPEHLLESIVRVQAGSAPDRTVPQPREDPLQLALRTAEKEQLLEALRRTGGNRTAAAALLNIHRATLYFRLKKHDINPADSGTGKA